MPTMHGKHCPECGKDGFNKEYMGGMDTGDLKCASCGEVSAPGELLDDAGQRSCKASGCARFIPMKQSHLLTGNSDYVPNLKKGIIVCPFCKAAHRAENVVIAESGPGTGRYSATFGEQIKS